MKIENFQYNLRSIFISYTIGHPSAEYDGEDIVIKRELTYRK